jgi:hypothetical protein
MAGRGKPGRRGKLTPETIERLKQGLTLGLTHELACQYAGIGKTSFYDWLARGRSASSGIHRELADAVAEAEGRNAANCMAVIAKAAQEGTWQAAAWIMERRHGYRAQAHHVVSETTAEADRFEELLRDPATRELLDAAADRAASLADQPGEDG